MPDNISYHELYHLAELSLNNYTHTKKKKFSFNPWYWLRYMIPLAGMIFTTAMNSVSFAAERLEAECEEVIRFNKTLNMKRVRGNKNQNFPDSSFWQKNSTCFCKGPFSFNSRSMAPME